MTDNKDTGKIVETIGMCGFLFCCSLSPTDGFSDKLIVPKKEHIKRLRNHITWHIILSSRFTPLAGLMYTYAECDKKNWLYRLPKR